MKRTVLVWGAIGLAWTALAFLIAISLWLNYLAQGREAHFGASLLVALAEWWIWALLTPIPVALARRWPVRGEHAWRRLAGHAVAGLAVSYIKVSAERGARTWLFGVSPYLLPSNLAFHWLVYAGIVAVTMAVDFYRRARARELEAARLEARLQEARLQLLAAQLQPHFLFNAFNAIAETIHEDPHRADQMITALGTLLRATLDGDGQATPLAREVELAEHYLAIQQARFGDRLAIDWRLATGLDGWRVPRLLLQPLLENAIRHGVAARKGAGRIRVTTRRLVDRLEIAIEDDGIGFEAPPTAGGGIGLANTRERLAQMYRGDARLDVRASDLGGAAVVVSLPESPR